MIELENPPTPRGMPLLDDPLAQLAGAGLTQNIEIATPHARLVARTRRALDAICFWGLMAVVALAPLPLASARPWAWGLAGLALAMLLILTALRFAIAGNDGDPLPRPIWLPAAILGAAAIAWALFQASDLSPESMQHPLWHQLSTMTGETGSGAISLDPSASMVSVFRLLEYAAVFVLAAELCSPRHRAYAAIRTVVVSGMGYALYGLIEFSAGNHHVLWFDKWAYENDLTSTFVNRNSFATYAGIALVCGTGLLLDDLQRLVIPSGSSAKAMARAVIQFVTVSRWWLVASLPVIAAALLLTHSRGGFLAASSGLMTLALAIVLAPGFTAPWKARGTAIIVTLIGIWLIANGGLTLGRLMETSLSTESRGQINAISESAIADFPWTGTGLGTFHLVFPAYGPMSFDEYPELAHNDYLENILELGIPAAAVFYLAAVWLLACCVSGIARRRRRAIFPCLGAAVWMLVGVHSLFDFSMQMPAVAFAAAAVIGVGVANARPGSTRNATD